MLEKDEARLMLEDGGRVAVKPHDEVTHHLQPRPLHPPDRIQQVPTAVLDLIALDKALLLRAGSAAVQQPYVAESHSRRDSPSSTEGTWPHSGPSSPGPIPEPGTWPCRASARTDRPVGACPLSDSGGKGEGLPQPRPAPSGRPGGSLQRLCQLRGRRAATVRSPRGGKEAFLEMKSRA